MHVRQMVRGVIVELFIMLVIGLLLGLIGPFGTFEMPTGVRIAFWVASALIGYAIFRPFVVVSHWVSDALNISPIISGGLALIVAALPLTFLIALFFSDFDAARVLAWQRLPALYFQVWLIGFVVNAVFHLISVRKTASPALATTAEGQAAPTIDSAAVQSEGATRLPVALGQIYALKGEDHYVRVIAQDGEQLVLMRLRDAIDQMDGQPGLQVHRSWWVASAGVAKVARSGRSAEVVLKTGATVPVARNMVGQLRDMRWL